MIGKVENLAPEQLDRIRKTIGEAFVPNELFRSWGSEDERRGDVLTYMSLYVDYVYQTGELYANEELTGFIGLEDSAHAPVFPRIRMILRMFAAIPFRRIRSFLRFAQEKADELGIPLLFDTDMKEYAELYRHLGCELYNTVTADNGVTRYSLCYRGDASREREA